MSTYRYGDHRLELRIDGERLAAIRRDHQLTQEALAINSGVSRPTIARIERYGEEGRPVHRVTWLRLCKALGLRSEADRRILLRFDLYDPTGEAEGEYEPVSLLRQRLAEEAEDRR